MMIEIIVLDLKGPHRDVSEFLKTIRYNEKPPDPGGV